jgi:hypothetical protein
MADDVVDTIAQYDLDDDFPDYANEQNKELNQIVSNFRFSNRRRRSRHRSEHFNF